MTGKIALEEHVLAPGFAGGADPQHEYMYGARVWGEIRSGLVDVDKRLSEMDKYGIDKVIISHTNNGPQGEPDPATATSLARETNDFIHDTYVSAHPDRFSAFAVLAVQDPAAAAQELCRTVDRGAKGALINGFSNIGNEDNAQYLDEEGLWGFWEVVQELGVPIYLHPRELLPHDGRRIYAGYAQLAGAAWGFAHETGTHAVRLMMSGLFDEFPRLQIVLGHLGEGLSFLLPRLDSRLVRQGQGIGHGSHKKPMLHYFTNNFVLTTSGHFNTPALRNAVDIIGADRVLFSVDYPYETTASACDWFDSLGETDGFTADVIDGLASGNAKRIFGL